LQGVGAAQWLRVHFMLGNFASKKQAFLYTKPSLFTGDTLPQCSSDFLQQPVILLFLLNLLTNTHSKAQPQALWHFNKYCIHYCIQNCHYIQ
jgi:hypothetical protein